MVSATGWSWDEALDGLTVPRFLALRAEWRCRPPTHWLVAGALRYQAPDASPRAARATLAEMQAVFS